MLSFGDGSLDEALLSWASRRLGFDRRALRLERLRLVAEREARRLGPGAFEWALAEGEAGLDAALVAAATVGETYFFRQREHFDLLSRLPFRGSAHKPLLAWSAACATGEETYSLALSLRRSLGLEFPELQIWGTDINQAALLSAGAAIYGPWSFRAGTAETDAVNPALGTAWNENLRKDVLDPKTQACVRFARHNLLESPAFDGGNGPRFHVIFCRNVLVYFQPQAIELALQHMVRALLPGGWLVMGNMDVSIVPEGTRRTGPSHLCVFERLDASPAKPAVARPVPQNSLKSRPLAARAPRQFIAKEFDPEHAVSWHRGVLAQLEAGDEAAALRDLRAMLLAFPRYLPGWFEQALALKRCGMRQRAAESLRETLRLAGGLDPGKLVAGPEPLSLDFYVVNAEIFLQSLGETS
jgi:chemotaxis methyl-accepting protein methylase